MEEGIVKYFIVYYNPDLTEGRGWRSSDIIVVNARDKHSDFVEHWCYEKFGNKKAFIMGSRYSTCITDNWHYKEGYNWDTYDRKILEVIEEEGIKSIKEEIGGN